MNRAHWTDREIVRAVARLQIKASRAPLDDYERVQLAQLLAECRKRRERARR